MVAAVQVVLPWSDSSQAVLLAPRPAPRHHGTASVPGPRRWGFAIELLAAYRADAGMTYRQLAKASGLTSGMVSGIERGTYQPNEAQVQALADALGVDDWALTWA